MVVRCTKKMLDLLGGRNLTLSDPAPTDDDWYLNLLWIERQKCLLLTHSGTLFSIFRASVRVADLRPLGNYLIDALATDLATEGFPADALSHFDGNDVRISKTASRRTLGYMNEMASELEWHIARDGGLDHADINELNHALRRMLRNGGGSDYARPIELVNHASQHPNHHAPISEPYALGDALFLCELANLFRECQRQRKIVD